MTGSTVDSSVLVAALFPQHDHHHLARPALRQATHLLAGCLAETWSVLARGQFRLPARDVAGLVVALTSGDRPVVAASADAFLHVFRAGTGLAIGSGIHDAVIARTCAEHGLRLATLDRRQATMAAAFGADATLLQAEPPASEQGR